MQQPTTMDLRELGNSLISFGGAASLFGASQLAGWLRPRAGDSLGDPALRLDGVTRRAAERLEGRLRTVFVAGDVFQRGFVNMAADLASLNPSGLLAAAGPVLEPVLAALEPVLAAVDRSPRGTDLETPWRELRNKLEIYLLVYNAENRLRITPIDRVPLAELVERAYALGPFPALWAIEGLGHIYAEQVLRDEPSSRGLLTSPEADAARPGALSMLHAGIGLAFAQRALGSTPAVEDSEWLRPAIEQFAKLCRENSRPGYAGAAYESLGLVAQTFHPELVAPVDLELRQRAAGADLLEFFWHGVGRAHYFAPRNFIPCNEIDWEGTAGSAPHDAGRLNIVAGLAWAVTVVNMRQPVVMERLLRRHGEFLARTPAFSNGVASAAVMRHDTTPDARILRDFVQHQPSATEPFVALAWEELVRGPTLSLLSDHESRRLRDNLGDIFRYHHPSRRMGRRDPRGAPESRAAGPPGRHGGRGAADAGRHETQTPDRPTP